MNELTALLSKAAPWLAAAAGVAPVDRVLLPDKVDDELQAAREHLRHAGLVNVKVIDVTAAQGARGLPAEGPFDVILLSGSVAEVPPELLALLKTGGRLWAVVGRAPAMRATLEGASADFC